MIVRLLLWLSRRCAASRCWQIRASGRILAPRWHDPAFSRLRCYRLRLGHRTYRKRWLRFLCRPL